MEALKVYTRAENGQVLVVIPTEMQNKPLEVVVRPIAGKVALENGAWVTHLEMVKERGESMRRLFGAAPFPDFKMDEDGWYNQ